jgi:hypothetical protein
MTVHVQRYLLNSGLTKQFFLNTVADAFDIIYCGGSSMDFSKGYRFHNQNWYVMTLAEFKMVFGCCNIAAE